MQVIGGVVLRFLSHAGVTAAVVGDAALCMVASRVFPIGDGRRLTRIGSWVRGGGDYHVLPHTCYLHSS